MESRVFGNTLYSLRGAALLGAMLSIAASLLVYFFAPVTVTQVDRALDSVLLGLGVFATIALAVLPTCLVSIRVDEARISQLLMGKLLLSSKPLSELQSITIGKPIGATLKFNDGTTMRFLGARLEFLRDLCDYLRVRCGESLEVEVATWAANLLPVGGKPRRLPNTSVGRTRER
jgi:hypothetical protein